MNRDDATAIVAALSRDLFVEHSPPDVQQSLVNELEHHGDCSRIVSKIVGGTSFTTHLIDTAYQVVSGRTPTAAERTEMNELIETKRYDKYDIPFVLLERSAAQPTKSDAALIATAYRVAFDRVLNVAEAAHWLEQIATDGRQTSVHRIWFCHERFTYFVSGLYRVHLRREADSEGVSWGTSYLHIHGFDAVRSALVSSEEFLERARSEAKDARMASSGEIDRLQPERPLVGHP